jgi:conjugal transfer ATP-binding protein TraC
MALNLFTMGKKKKKTPKGAAATAAPEGGKTPAEVLAEGMINVRDIIAPAAMEIDYNHLRIGNTYYRTMFVSGYPRFVGANWLSPIINFEHSLDLSMFYYPVKSKMILDDLRRKITELEATIMSTREKGKVLDPVVTAALEDANALQEQLVKGVEKYFKFSFYITIPAGSLEELETVSSRLESTLGSLLLISKTASLQMEEAFQSTIPCGFDKMLITRNMDTTSLATTFPFTSSDLTMEEGIMYGINKSNGSLIIFERFSLENANTVVFAKSGSGKSFFVKLEALRLMVFGAEVMIIDPEEEYRALCEAVGGNYIDFSANSPSKINPFDLSGIAVEGENELGQKLISLITLFKLMLGGLSSTEEALLDRALIETYRIKGISTDPDTQSTKEPPVMEDIYKVLLGMEETEARSMAERLEKFIKGSMTGIFDAQSNIDLNSKMTVFSTKNLEDALRPIAFYMILDFIWTRIRKDLRKRILIVEEAWYLMQNEDSARFIYGIAKRARKYYLGLTTVSQDVDDFLASEYGKAIVTNSSIQVLLKQHPAAIDKVADTFYLSEGEKRLLLAANVGEGLFFAGSNHVAIKVMASDAEYKLITTNPEEILRLRNEGMIRSPQPKQQPTYKPYIPPSSPDKYTTFDEKGRVREEYISKTIGGKISDNIVRPALNPTQPPPRPMQPGQAPQNPPAASAPMAPRPNPQPNNPNNMSGGGPRPMPNTANNSDNAPKFPPGYAPSADDIIAAVAEEVATNAMRNKTMPVSNNVARPPVSNPGQPPRPLNTMMPKTIDLRAGPTPIARPDNIPSVSANVPKVSNTPPVPEMPIQREVPISNPAANVSSSPATTAPVQPPQPAPPEVRSPLPPRAPDVQTIKDEMSALGNQSGDLPNGPQRPLTSN